MAEDAERQSVYDKVVALINESNSTKSPSTKIEKLIAVQDLIVHKDPTVLDNFLDEVISFQSDHSPDVRSFVLTFIAEACKKDNELLSKLIINISFMLTNDEDVNVQKKVIAVMAQLYPVALKWITKMRSVTSVMEQTWDFVVQLKTKIIPMADADNDGIRSLAIKFLEQCVLSQSSAKSSSASASESTSASGSTITTITTMMSLDQMPRDHRLISYRKLEADGKSLFQKLIGMLGSQHISSVNLMVCMGSLTTIAASRPEFMERVVLAFDSLHVNLPPTLAKSQVTSVRKSLKLRLLSLLKHPSSIDHHPQMIMLLTDLGAKSAELSKALPAGSSHQPSSSSRGGSKRSAAISSIDQQEIDSQDGFSTATSKKPRLAQRGGDNEEEDDDEEDEDDEASRGSRVGGGAGAGEPDSSEKRRQQAIETTASVLYGKLTNPGSVADLVLVSLVVLPDSMPAHFQASYTPIAAAGTEAQIRHLSRLMATQFTAKGVGPGAEQLKAFEAEKRKAKMEESGMTPSITLSSRASSTKQQQANKEAAASEKVHQHHPPIIPVGAPPPSAAGGQTAARRLHKFGLAHITKPMDHRALSTMMAKAWERIMGAEKRVVNGGATNAHAKILVRMASTFNLPDLQNNLVSFILADPKTRSDIAILWVYQEYQDYCTFSGFSHTFLKDRDEGAEKYDACLCRLLSTLFERGEHKESVFHKLMLEAPVITVNALHILMRACLDMAHGSLGLTTLKEMIVTRPIQRDSLLRVLLDFTTYERTDIRHHSLEIAKELYAIQAVRENVKDHVKAFLNNLRRDTPSPSLFGETCGRPENPGKWTEESIRATLFLYLYLLPTDHSLIHELADVYVAAISDVKRVIMKLLEGPIKAVGINSPELLLLVERCPPGAETLITLIVRLLTERSAPTPELVKRVQNLYPRRVSDVRFVIPVLTGLNKKEVLAVLPELIRLKPDVVRQVFNILYPKGSPENRHHSLRPSELMIALHQLDVSNEETMKYVIAAIDTLLNDRKDLYRKDTLPGVIQHLIEQQPLPVLFMRTIMKVYKNHEQSLAGFVMNMLQRLILKQVWKHPQAWLGFVRFCSMAASRTSPLLVNLPAPQLREAFLLSPELKAKFEAYLSSLPLQQQARVPKTVWQVLQGEQQQQEQQVVQEEADKLPEEVVEPMEIRNPDLGQSGDDGAGALQQQQQPSAEQQMEQLQEAAEAMQEESEPTTVDHENADQQMLAQEEDQDKEEQQQQSISVISMSNR